MIENEITNEEWEYAKAHTTKMVKIPKSDVEVKDLSTSDGIDSALLDSYHNLIIVEEANHMDKDAYSRKYGNVKIVGIDIIRKFKIELPNGETKWVTDGSIDGFYHK